MEGVSCIVRVGPWWPGCMIEWMNISVENE